MWIRLPIQLFCSFFAFVVLLSIVLMTFYSPSSKIFLMCSLKTVFFWPLGTCFLVTLFNRLKYQKSLRDTYLYFQYKMQITGFKHKYPTIEFNSENPKKEC